MQLVSMDDNGDLTGLFNVPGLQMPSLYSARKNGSSKETQLGPGNSQNFVLQNMSQNQSLLGVQLVARTADVEILGIIASGTSR